MGNQPTVRAVYDEATSKRPDLVSRFLPLEDGRRSHVLERPGDGTPTVLLHGGGACAATFLPLVDALDRRWVVAPDRPGFGLSDPVTFDPATYRSTAVEFVGGLLDRLGVEQADLVGNSMGGTWALWFALAHSDRVGRVALLGAPPLTPGTRIPTPLRLMAAPVLGGLLSRLLPASASSVRQMMGSFGEGETVDDHPEVLAALVATAGDERNGTTNLEETRAVMTALGGFRSHLELSVDELRGLDRPVLVVAGQHDPVGGRDVGRRLADALPDARLEVLPTGHLPWLGRPAAVARLVDEVIHGGP